MSKTYLSCCDKTVEGLYLNCPKCGVDLMEYNGINKKYGTFTKEVKTDDGLSDINDDYEMRDNAYLEAKQQLLVLISEAYTQGLADATADISNMTSKEVFERNERINEHKKGVSNDRPR